MKRKTKIFKRESLIRLQLWSWRAQWIVRRRDLAFDWKWNCLRVSFQCRQCFRRHSHLRSSWRMKSCYYYCCLSMSPTYKGAVRALMPDLPCYSLWWAANVALSRDYRMSLNISDRYSIMIDLDKREAEGNFSKKRERINFRAHYLSVHCVAMWQFHSPGVGRAVDFSLNCKCHSLLCRLWCQQSRHGM